MNAHKFIPAVLALVMMSSTLQAEASTQDVHAKVVKLLGAPAQPESAERTITITEKTKSLNVVGGKTVKFVTGDKAFAWHFDGPFSSFRLNQVAPKGVLDHIVTVYVTPNPLYFGG
jgi:hypothetical protein